MGSWVSWGFTRNIDIEMHKSKGEAIMTFQTWDSHCREPFSISGSSINLSYKYSWSKSALDTVRAFSLSLSLLRPLQSASTPSCFTPSPPAATHWAHWAFQPAAPKGSPSSSIPRPCHRAFSALWSARKRHAGRRCVKQAAPGW